ncbi:MAG: hypothetical protein J5933_02510 [Clostridia bacterium]|nr:hypothetical protein [Clostridia bacterium]
MKKRIISLLLDFVLIVCGLLSVSCGPEGDGGTETGENGAPAPSSAGKTFYVSPDGSDEGDGTEEQPLASFAGAVSAVRAYKEENGVPEGGIEVLFAGGRYVIDSQIVLGPEDSGEEGRPVLYRAVADEEVILDGGVIIDPAAFGPLSDSVMAKLGSEDASEHVLEADLALAGCYDLAGRTDYTELSNTTRYTGYRQELYVDDVRQNSARWPDSGYEITEIKKAGGSMSELVIPEEKAAKWAGETALRYYGYPYLDWSANNVQEDKISIDAERSVLSLPEMKYSQDTIKSKYYVYNALCELDSPGEYYWDVGAGKLYYYPDGDLSGKKIVFSQFAGEWICLKGASHVAFSGFTAENARDCIFANSEEDEDATSDISLYGCTFRDLGTFAVRLYGSEIRIEKCCFYNIGAGCVVLTGGKAKGMVCGNSLVKNCVFHDWAQTFTTGTSAVWTSGYGFTISHNEMSFAPHKAVELKCGESVVEYNYIHDVCRETSDAGSVYIGRRWDWSKNEIRYNLIRNIIDVTFGGLPHAIYLDDMVSGQRVYGNVMENIAAAGVCSGGRYNYIVNNILINVDSVRAIAVFGRGMGDDIGYDHVNYAYGDMWEHMREGDYLSDVMRLAVPKNLLMLENPGYSEKVDDPGTPSYNTVMNNIIVVDEDPGRWHIIYTDNDITDECSNIQSNIIYTEDPGFSDPENGDYTLKSGSRVLRDMPTFRSIDLSAVGPEKG